jgi:hypothetical protein
MAPELSAIRKSLSLATKMEIHGISTSVPYQARRNESCASFRAPLSSLCYLPPSYQHKIPLRFLEVVYESETVGIGA